MTESDWETFFDLLKRIIDLPKLSANEKIALFKDKAHENGVEEYYFEEFQNYISED